MTTWREFLLKIGVEADEKPLEQIEKRIEGIHHALEFLAAAELARGMYELTERFAHFAEELHVASVAAGMTIEDFQRLSLAAQQSSVSQEQMSQAMARLSRQIYEARRGNSEAIMAFSTAGISPTQLQGFRSAGDALLALSGRMQGMRDPVEKLAISTQLMGRGSYQMIGFLSQGPEKIRALGGEFERLGAVLRDDQIEKLVSLEHAMGKLWAVMKAFGATVATYLAPIVETAIKDFLDFYAANRKVIEVNVKAWAEDLAYALGFIHGLVQGLIERFLRWAAAHQEVVRRVFEVVAAFMTLSIAMGFLHKALDIGMSLWKLWTAPIGFAIQALKLVRWALSEFLLKLAAATDAEWLFAAAGAAAEAPLWLVGAAIAALVLGVQALWTVLSGGSFKDTWLGELISGAGSALGSLGGWLSKTLGIGDAFGKFGSALGVGSGEAAYGTGNNGQLYGLPEKAQMLGGAMANLSGLTVATGGGAGAGVSYQDNAQYHLTVQLPAGANDRDMESKIRQVIKQSHDEQARRLQQTLRPQVEY